MEGFDTITMNYLASPLPLSNMPGADYLNAMGSIGMADQHSDFDAETFVSGDDLSFAQSLPHPGMKHFSAGFDDSFAVDLAQFDGLGPEQPLPESSVDRDNKLLGFSLPIYSFALLDYSVRRTSLSLSAQLHGMFFLAESPWPSTGDSAPPPPELTCYRRNLFQITGTITLPRALRYIMTEHGDRIPILAQELTISATESVEGNQVKIIAVPWKTPATSTVVPEDKTEKEPPSIPLDTMAGQDLDSDYATFPIAWKRLQFRIATANNGRRKELQQHFVVRLKVVATLSTGAKISICEVRSGPIIVRGRSPRNFQSRKDFPISGSTSSARKSLQQPGITRTSTNDSASQLEQPPPAKRQKTPEVPQMVFQYGESELQSSPGFPDWTQIQASVSDLPTPSYPPPNPLLPTSAPMPSQIPPCYPQSPDMITHTPAHQRQSSSTRLSLPLAATPPIHLSLLDDEPLTPPTIATAKKSPNKRASTSSIKPRPNPTSNSAAHSSAKNPRLSNPLPFPSSHPYPQISYTTASPNLTSTPDGSADLLYEYFPLGLDDWMPPVDAVYRPHVVHHTAPLPPDPKAVAAMGRSRRYFSGEY